MPNKTKCDGSGNFVPILQGPPSNRSCLGVSSWSSSHRTPAWGRSCKRKTSSEVTNSSTTPLKRSMWKANLRTKRKLEDNDVVKPQAVNVAKSASQVVDEMNQMERHRDFRERLF